MLNIYRASAGAGKTHHLTGEYIKLLFRRDLLPEGADHQTRFDEVLAVTFTNKATAEMKARILEELDILSKTPEKSDYNDELREDGAGHTLTNEVIQQKAHDILNDILNNYSDFAVTTIDSFFQKITRSFVRELNLPCNYEIELNSGRILDAAVSAFMDKLDNPANQTLFNWMLEFSRKKIEDGAGWRIEKDLKALAKSVLTSETFRIHSNQIGEVTKDKKFLTEYASNQKRIIVETKTKLKEIGKKGDDIIKTVDPYLSYENFKGKSNCKLKTFARWGKGEIVEPDGTLEDFFSNPLNWYNAPKTKNSKKGASANDGSPENRLSAEAERSLQQLFNQVVDMRESRIFLNYHTAHTIIEKIYQLGILADIDREAIEFCNDEGTMLLTNTTEMLNKLVTVDDAPFIYEKLGTHIQNFMIDEFQDTSKMQWENFRPLIENSIANGRQDLIVGDVKQSIYRWRGSDWGLLYNGLNDVAKGQVKEDKDTLKKNYRTQNKVVNFNNTFFSSSAESLAKAFNNNIISDIYSDVVQDTTKKEDDAPGIVKMQFINISDKGTKYEDEVAELIPQAVIELEDNGFKAKDIAILCRKKEFCKIAASSLLKYKTEHPEDTVHKFDIISNEALQLNSRHVIITIISILRYLQKPQSKIQKSLAAFDLIMLEGHNEAEAINQYFHGDRGIERFLEFTNLPLYDMVEGILSKLSKESLKDIAFIQAFKDCVIEFSNNKKSDLTGFLEWWDTKSSGLCINSPEEQDAIRIMTIHKAKGLGMPAVILPFTMGTLDIAPKNSDIIWCEPKFAPFAKDGLMLPVRLSSALTNTIFSKDFEEEKLRQIIDNLNTIYVAFTRAKEAMVIMSPTPTAKDDDKKIQKLLYSYFTNDKNKNVSKINENEYCIGEWMRAKKHDKSSSADNYSSIDTSIPTRHSIPRLALKHDRVKSNVEAIEKGNIMHEALSEIIDYDHIDNPDEEIANEIKKLLANPEVRPWFRPGLTILNERTLISKKASSDDIQRPDRVIIDGDKVIIIDYKTGQENKEYERQVKRYMWRMKEMGFKNVEGYLWYLYPHNVSKVNPERTNKSK